MDVSNIHKQDITYFGRLLKQMQSGGREALLHYLMHYDITEVNLRELPQTAATFETKLLSRTPQEQWIIGMLRDGVNSFQHTWDEWVPNAALQLLFQRFTEDASVRGRGTQTELGLALRRLVPGAAPRRRLVDGKHAHGTTFPPLAEARADLERVMQTAINWDDLTARLPAARGGRKGRGR
jgi:hypothetical protein